MNRNCCDTEPLRALTYQLFQMQGQRGGDGDILFVILGYTALVRTIVSPWRRVPVRVAGRCPAVERLDRSLWNIWSTLL